MSLLELLEALLLWLFPPRHKVKPPKNLTLEFYKGADMQFHANLTWTPSVTPTVTTQKLSIQLNGQPTPVQSFGPTVNSFTFLVNPGDSIAASLVANDGVTDSAPATVSGTAPPAPVAPEPPTGLTLAFTPAS